MKSAIKGGQKTQQFLASIARKLATGNTVRVGFLEGTTYPASAGPARLLKGVDKLNRVGPFKKGRKPGALRQFRKRRRTFVGPQKTAAVLSVATIAYWNNFGTSRTKARPFFSEMITENSPRWGSDLAKVIIEARYDSRVALGRMGEIINGQLVKKIVDWPADNAPLTVAIKGFNHGLIDRGVMQRSSGYEVVQ